LKKRLNINKKTFCGLEFGKNSSSSDMFPNTQKFLKSTSKYKDFYKNTDYLDFDTGCTPTETSEFDRPLLSSFARNGKKESDFH
jgi:hypothetical protein